MKRSGMRVVVHPLVGCWTRKLDGAKIEVYGGKDGHEQHRTGARMTTTDSTTTQARAPSTVPAMVLPCNLPCPKCGATDINRLFRGKGTERPSEKYGHPISRFESAESWTAVAWRDHIMHHCRVCQYDWQTPSLPRRRQNKGVTVAPTPGGA